MNGMSQLVSEVHRRVDISMSDDQHHRQSLEGLHIHMIGIGGSGMCGLAQIALQCGANVTGSERASNPAVAKLVRLGVPVTFNQQAGELPSGTQWVICSAAVSRSNPELAAATARGLKILKYSEMLGRVMEFKEGIAVAGTHGKSTTTAMTAWIFTCAGLDPSFVVGASIDQLGGSSHGGAGPHFIAEACEFDRSFLNLRPRCAAVLNVEPDHLDYYKDIDEIVAAFCNFIGCLQPGGKALLPAADPHHRRLAETAGPAAVSFGVEVDADISARNLSLADGCFAFDLYQSMECLGRTILHVPGRHNVANAVAAAGLALLSGIDASTICSALASFRGARRRSELIRQAGGITLVDDYAHHPTEIQVTLAALRTRWRPKRLICVFQPHQHSRTRCFMEEFARSFTDADMVIVPDIHFARDTAADESGVKAGTLVEKINHAGVNALHLPQFTQVVEYLDAHRRPGDLIISMGAGNVWKVTHELAKRI